MGRAKRICELNDGFRRSLAGGRVLMTAGVLAQGQTFARQALAAVRAFDAFIPDDDPHGEHDFGAIEIDGRRLFWKIDYYEPTGQTGSSDPADPTLTLRVLTIFSPRSIEPPGTFARVTCSGLFLNSFTLALPPTICRVGVGAALERWPYGAL